MTSDADKARRAPWYELSSLIYDNETCFTFEGTGHSHAAHEIVLGAYTSCINTKRISQTKEDPHPVIEALKQGRAVPKEQAVHFSITTTPCQYCDQTVNLSFDGQCFRAVTECPIGAHPEDLIIELNVPSGKLVVTDRLDDLFPMLGEFNINRLIGVIKTTLACAEIGYANLQTREAILTVHRIPGQTNRGLCVVYGDDPTPAPYKGERVARLLADLSWYAMADLDEYLRHNGPLSCPDIEVIDIEPGVYRLTHRRSRTDWLSLPDQNLFTRIEWVRPPDPVRDFKAEFQARQLTAGQVLWRYTQENPEVLEKENGICQFADRLFCGIEDWHPNGFRVLTPDSKASDPEIAIPHFERREIWHCCFLYQRQERNPLILAANGELPLNPSFVAVAHDILTSIVNCGIETRTAPERPEADASEEKRLVELARATLEAFNKRYPPTP